MTKVIPRIIGGIGNQLFCYAAARRLALISDAELVIDHVSGFMWDHAYRRGYQLDHFNIPCRKASSMERMEPFSRVRRMLKRKWNQGLALERRSYIQQQGVGFDPRLLQIKPHGTLYLEGYWQSEGYFKDVEHIIRQDLRIRPPTDPINQTMAAKIRACAVSVAIHVRFFDAPEVITSTNNAPTDYYTSAIEKMEALEPGAHYFVFSDRPSAALVPLQDERVTLVSHNQGDAMAYADLWLMSQCHHFIIANSTFSWWGAWLAQGDGKRIIAPGFEKRIGEMSWGFPGLLPDDWVKL